MSLEDLIGAIRERRDALQAELKLVEAMLKASGEKPRRRTRKPKAAAPKKRRKRAAASKPNRPGVSQATLDRVYETVTRIGHAAGTVEIAEQAQLPQGTVGRALSFLAKEGRINQAGNMPNVRGRRPMYAPWPDITQTTEQQPERVGS